MSTVSLLSELIVGSVTGENKGALAQFLVILTLPDNIPIVGMLFLVLFFSYLAMREGRKNDQLLEEGREDEILTKMQE
jgi:hypothetical protein